MAADDASPPGERFERFVDPTDGTVWDIDVGFVESGWTCIWSQGCPGIGAEPDPEGQLGCCSVGAELLDADEARRVGALGLALDPDRFQYAAAASVGGVFAGGGGRPAATSPITATRVIDGACIFLNRPGFVGGAGCALHLAALDEGESPIDWKPSVCWQLPLRVDERPDGSRRLRRWRRADWSAGAGDPEHGTVADRATDRDRVAWCCTEDRTTDGGSVADAYIGHQPLVATLGAEVAALVGREVYVQLERRVRSRAGQLDRVEPPTIVGENSNMTDAPQSLPTDEQWLSLNEGVIAEFRANGGQCGGRWEGNPMVLLTTTGAKSGKARTSPLTYTTDGDRIVLVASRAGDHRHPDWYHNLVANPDVIVEVGEERFEAVASVADEPERTRLLGARIEVMPRFGGYVEATDRTIPVVVVARRS